MILGVDLDNTLICYDGLFHAAAVERGLMSVDGPTSKRGVRSWLIERDAEKDFTLLQGYVYGPGLAAAKPYAGARETLVRLKAAGARLYVVSHKTAAPHLGPVYDLRQAAREWLEANEFYAPVGPLAREAVFLEETQEEKAERIRRLGCTHFIDDLERFFAHPRFPAETKPLLFQPPGLDDAAEAAGSVDGLAGFSSWRELGDTLAAEIVNA